MGIALPIVKGLVLGLIEEVPMGDSVEDRRARGRLIRQFYYQWMGRNDDRKVFNTSLNDYISSIHPDQILSMHRECCHDFS